LKYYFKALKKEGLLLMSGFYREDESVISSETLKNRLAFINGAEKNNWYMGKYEKS
jgi:ribosomal protein L11 methyltransferase